MDTWSVINDGAATCEKRLQFAWASQYRNTARKRTKHYSTTYIYIYYCTQIGTGSESFRICSIRWPNDEISQAQQYRNNRYFLTVSDDTFLSDLGIDATSEMLTTTETIKLQFNLLSTICTTKIGKNFNSYHSFFIHNISCKTIVFVSIWRLPTTICCTTALISVLADIIRPCLTSKAKAKGKTPSSENLAFVDI